MFVEWQAYFISQYISLAIAFSDMGVRDWAAIISIGWVLYQLIERRRVSETNIDKYLERHFSDKSKGVEEQRRTLLARLTAAGSAWGLSKAIRFLSANVMRLLLFIWRLAKLDFRNVSARHAMLLFDSGASGAKKEFLQVADSLLATAKTYRRQAALKRLEAINALIFAGRVAAIEKDSEATIDAFKRAIAIKDGDYDARKFIGQQFQAVGNLTAALDEFRQLSSLGAVKKDKALAAEAHRLQAAVLIERGDVRLALEALDSSLKIEAERRNSAGLATTHEIFGDAHACGGTILDAASSYKRSLENYHTIGDKKGVRRVQGKLWRLQPEETFLSRAVTALGTFLIERVAKQLRAPAQTP